MSANEEESTLAPETPEKIEAPISVIEEAIQQIRENTGLDYFLASLIAYGRYKNDDFEASVLQSVEERRKYNEFVLQECKRMGFQKEELKQFNPDENPMDNIKEAEVIYLKNENEN